MNRLLAWLDRRNFVSVRAGTLYVTVWMTWEITRWCFDYARASSLPGIEVAAVLAAVTVPFCAMQAAVFRFYLDSK